MNADTATTMTACCAVMSTVTTITACRAVTPTATTMTACHAVMLRGCRDNVMMLRTLIEDMLERGEQVVATFVDYSAAFDSVSHKFIDTALADAGVSAKSRAIFRAIYKAASATTRVADTDGKYVQSKSFPIRRGVVQGDITSPLYFVIDLQLILK